jgi:hypothetical protein
MNSLRLIYYGDASIDIVQSQLGNCASQATTQVWDQAGLCKICQIDFKGETIQFIDYYGLEPGESDAEFESRLASITNLGDKRHKDITVRFRYGEYRFLNSILSCIMNDNANIWVANDNDVIIAAATFIAFVSEFKDWNFSELRAGDYAAFQK